MRSSVASSSSLGAVKAVIVAKDFIKPPLLDQKQGEVPAVMVGHEMRRRPIRAGRLEKGDTLFVPVRGLHHVRQRMGRPSVAPIAG